MMKNLVAQGSAQEGEITSQSDTCIKFPNNPFPLCMMKILGGGRADDTLCPPENNFCHYPPHVSGKIREPSSNPTLSIFHCLPFLIHNPAAPPPPTQKFWFVNFFTALEGKNANLLKLTPRSILFPSLRYSVTGKHM